MTRNFTDKGSNDLPRKGSLFSDLDLVDWMRYRSEGFSCRDIAESYGSTPDYVRAATGKVVREDAKHHNEPIKFSKTR